MSDLVTLNVGGSLFTTTVATLTRYPDSMLGSMFSSGQQIPTHRDNNGHYTIDRDGPIFRHVLNFLRNPSLCLPPDFKEWDLLSAEAEFFQIKELIVAVKSLKEERSGDGSRQGMEFIQISFSDRYQGSVMYRGTAATLKDIPTLLLHHNQNSISDERCIEHYVDAYGRTVADNAFRLDRMKTYQEITRLGFRLLNTTFLGLKNNNEEKYLFVRKT